MATEKTATARRSFPMTANAAAGALSRDLRRPIGPKSVRDVARTILATYSKDKHPAYQSHGYTAAEYARLLAAFKARGSRVAPVKAPKAAPKRARKATATRARKAAPDAPSAS